MEEKEFGPFSIEGRLGSGASSTVYLARREGLVALKILQGRDPERVRRLQREARLSMELSHSNLVKGFEFGSIEGRYYLSMEYVPTLLMDKKTFLEEKAAAAIAVQIASALGVLHGRALVHRDVKPDNIRLSQGTAKLLDLGLAKSLKGETFMLTEPGFAVGTPHYMSPEQARGLDVDIRSDLYSLGATLYYMLTGRPPFVPAPYAELLKQQMKSSFEDPRRLRPELSEGICRLIARALSPDPARRPSTPSEFTALLA